MNIFLYSFIIFIAAFKYNLNGNDDWWWSAWALSCLFGLIMLSIELFKRIHWSVVVLLFWSILSWIFIVPWYDNFYTNINPSLRSIIAYHSSHGTMCLMFLIFIFLFNYKRLNVFRNAFLTLCVANSIYVICQWINGNQFLFRGGFCGNASINGCLIAFTYPLVLDFCFHQRTKLQEHINILSKSIMIIAPIVAIFCTKTSVPAGTLLVATSSFLFFRIRNIKLKIIIPVIIISLILLTGYLIDPSNFFDDAARFKLYDIAIDSFFTYRNIWFGSGTATFPFFGIVNQQNANVMVGSWAIWLHNDWIQIMYENGIIGLGLALSTFIFFIWYAIKKSKYTILSCGLAYAASMVFDYPMHYPLQAMFGIFLICEIFLKKLISRNIV